MELSMAAVTGRRLKRELARRRRLAPDERAERGDLFVIRGEPRPLPAGLLVERGTFRVEGWELWRASRRRRRGRR